MKAGPAEGMKLLVELHAQIEDPVCLQINFLGQTYQKKSDKGEQFLEQSKIVAHCGHLLQPHFKSLNKEIQEQVYLALLSTFSDITIFLAGLKMYCPPSTHPDLWNSMKQGFPTLVELVLKEPTPSAPAASTPAAAAMASNNTNQPSEQDPTSFALDMMGQIEASIPAHLRSKYREAVEQDPLLGPVRFLQTHLSELGPDFDSKMRNNIQSNPALQAMAQGLASMDPGQRNEIMQAALSGDVGKVATNMASVMPKNLNNLMPMGAKEKQFLNSKIALLPPHVQPQAHQLLDAGNIDELEKLFSTHLTQEQLAEMLRESIAQFAPSTKPD